MQYATTAKAKSKIHAILKREMREKQRKGEDMLNAFFAEMEKAPNSMVIDRLCALHEVSTREELFAAIGSARVVLGNQDRDLVLEKNPENKKSWSRYLEFFKRGRGKQTPEGVEAPNAPSEKIDRKKPLCLNEETMGKYIMCDCCHPIPGDDVLGYFDDDNRITIHKRQCAIAAKLKSSYGNHILAANWDTHKQLYFPATLHLEGIDHMGVLHQITGVLSQQMNVNMRKVHIETNDGIFTAEIQLEVHDVEDLQAICLDLKKIPEVQVVNRF